MQADDILAEGRAHHLAGRLQLAEDAYRRAIGIDPGHVDSFRFLACLAYELGRHAVADGIFRHVAARRPAGYSPQIFENQDVTGAKAIILTADDEGDVEERWRRETPWFAEQIASHLGLDEKTHVLDFGCGIGRLARAVIERAGARVTGIDISPTMRGFARDYVGDQRFSAISPEAHDAGHIAGQRADAAYSVYVIQHVDDPWRELVRIAAGLVPGGRFFLANSATRWVPTDAGWQSDNEDVFALTAHLFALEAEIPFPVAIAWDPALAEETLIRVYRKR